MHVYDGEGYEVNLVTAQCSCIGAQTPHRHAKVKDPDGEIFLGLICDNCNRIVPGGGVPPQLG